MVGSLDEVPRHEQRSDATSVCDMCTGGKGGGDVF